MRGMPGRCPAGLWDRKQRSSETTSTSRKATKGTNGVSCLQSAAAAVVCRSLGSLSRLRVVEAAAECHCR